MAVSAESENRVNVFRVNSEMRYEKDITTEIIFDTVEYGPDHLELIAGNGFLTEMDYFILRSVMFYRRATVDMVADYIIYYRNRYGARECSNIPLPPVWVKGSDVVDEENTIREVLKNLRHRLMRMAKKGLVYAERYMAGENGGFDGYVFTISYSGFKLLNNHYGRIENFNGPYIGRTSYKAIEDLATSKVAIHSLMEMCPSAVIKHEDYFIYGSEKRMYHPHVHAKIEKDGVTHHVMFEPLHRNIDPTIISYPEWEESVQERLSEIHKVARHFHYIRRNHGKNEFVYFIFVCENLESIQKSVRMMDMYKDDFNERVFFTTSEAVKLTKGDLKKCLITARTKEAEQGMKFLGLSMSLRLEKNAWLLPDSNVQDK